MLDYIYHMTLKLLLNHVKMLRLCHIHYVIMDLNTIT